MKNQYFGDIRDLFKYDLIQRILKETGSLQKFSFIPMLTKDDPKKGDGNKRDFARPKKDRRPGTKNERLMGFLRNTEKRDERDFRKIGNYFESEGIKTLIYYDRGYEYFEHEARDRYFKNIPGEYLRKSLVFADPDIGLEVKNSTEKHLLYSEVRQLYDRMDKGSILMIYQHFPRKKHKEYRCTRARQLKFKTQTTNLPIYISDNEIIFLLVTKSDELRNQLAKIIGRYKRDYPKRLVTGNVD